MTRHLAKLLFLFLFTISTFANAAYDPGLHWQQLESPHFIVYFPEQFTFLAQKSALHLEQIYLEMGQFMDHYPAQKVAVLITDHTDSANGSAQVSPQPIIKYYVTPFPDLSELMDMEDRTKSLLTHEYMHILQLDTIRGLPKIVDLIFGPWWVPNSIQPQFLIEGFAVYAESKDGKMGRLNSPLMTGYLRALAAAGELPTLDQLANSRRRWPYGNIPYLLGGHLVQKMDQISPGWAQKYSHLYGQGIIPYFIMSRSYHLGLSLPAVYNLLISDIYRQTAEKQSQTAVSGLLQGKLLTSNGHNKSQLLRLGDNIYFSSGNGNDDSAIYSLSLADNNITRVTRSQSDSQLAAPPGGDYLLFTVTESQNSFTFFNEVKRLQLGRHHAQRVANAPQRLQQPVFSHDGSQIAYIINTDGHSQLWIAKADFSQPVLVQQAPDDRVYYNPQFSPDDRQLITATWYNGGQRLFDIFVKNENSYQYATSFSPGGRNLSGQHFSADGRRFYFHGDLDHETFDIFALTANDSPGQCHLYQVTSSVAGAFYPLEADGNLYYLEMDAQGYELATRPLELPNWHYLKEIPCPGLFDDNKAVQTTGHIPSAQNDITTGEYGFKTGRYSPWYTLIPRLWMPTLSQDNFGYALGFSTSGSDILGHHSYSLAVEYGLTSYYPGIYFSYTNAMLPFNISVGINHYLGIGRATVNNIWRRQLSHQITNASLSLDYSISRWNYYWYFSADYQFRFYRPYTRQRYYSGTNIKIDLPDDRYGALGLNVGFSNARSFNQSLHTAKGFILSAGLQIENPAFGSNHQSYVAVYNYQQYQQIKPLRTTLAWKIQGAFGYSPEITSPLFGLGGPATSNIINVLSSLSPTTSNYLRGFESNALTGNSYVKATFEWRLLLWRIEHGIQTLPIYFDTLHLALFCDVAYAVDSLKELQHGTLAIGPGAELRLDIKLGYYEAGTVTFGYARGIGPGGINNFYLLYGYLF